MKKKIHIDENAQKELNEFSQKVQDEFGSFFEDLKAHGKLEFPEGRKIDKKLFEIRVQLEDAYRGFYAYLEHPYIIILHVFIKKTQKTPIKNLKIARKRLRYYE